MTGFRDPADVLRTAKAIRFRDASNTLRTVKAIRFRDASNTLRTLYGIGGLTAIVLPGNIAGWGYSSGAIRVTTGAATMSVTGGSGSYTYAWSVPGGSGWAVINPTGASTQFRSPLLSAGSDSAITASCTATDTVTGTTATATVDVAASNTF